MGRKIAPRAGMRQARPEPKFLGMSRRGGGGSLGLVLLVVVMAVVLLLVARSWRAVAPQARAVTAPRVTDPALTASPGELPDLDETRKRTDAHAQQVQDALNEVE
jgi:hypothetical protein